MLCFASGEPSEEPKTILPHEIILSPIQWSLDNCIAEATTTEPAPMGCPVTKTFVPTSQCLPLMRSVISGHWPPRDQQDPLAYPGLVLVAMYGGMSRDVRNVPWLRSPNTYHLGHCHCSPWSIVTPGRGFYNRSPSFLNARLCSSFLQREFSLIPLKTHTQGNGNCRTALQSHLRKVWYSRGYCV